MQVSAAFQSHQHHSQAALDDATTPLKTPLRGLGKAAMVLGGLAILTSPLGILPAQAESYDDMRRLLSGQGCNSCDLSQAGLVFANLEAAELSNANLSQANLSRATLSHANLRGANLAGAVLYGANLYNADLTGADLRGADLRGAYLGGVKLEAGQLQGAALQGAIAIPANFVNAETYQTWGVNEAQASRHEAAINYYNKALEQAPKMASAYLGRSFSVSVLGGLDQATRDAETAQSLFTAEGNQAGADTAAQILLAIDSARLAAAEWEANPESKKANSTSTGTGSRRNWGRTFGSLFKRVGTMVFNTIF